MSGASGAGSRMWLGALLVVLALGVHQGARPEARIRCLRLGDTET